MAMPNRSAAVQIPDHLKTYIARQDASLYTAIDHASWRFILRVSRAFFAQAAHQKYLDGLEETGISLDRIPLVEEMDAKLKRFGWRAVPVSGFIPPAAFMEFQSLGILPIACEMRTLDHLAYTPAPDIVHEAAGHAPIIADPEYAEYLRNYGEVSRKAIFSDKDMEVYEAVRRLSVVKEDPTSTPAEIERAQKQLDVAIESVDYLSEATYLARMNWWTVEYGLVGRLDQPKIYGAGLLSSVGESYNCLRPEVKKIPFSLACIQTEYDITRPQPQLFVVSDFQELTRVLEEFAATMAFRIGGSEGLKKAQRAGTLATVELDTGLQISGIVDRVITGSSGEVEFFKLRGQAQLALADRQLPAHGPNYHAHGYSTPLGPFRGGKSLQEGSLARLEFASGFVLEGKLRSRFEHNAQPILYSFDQCRITRGNEVFFEPEWGTFDLAIGTRVRSVFGGAADRGAWIREIGAAEQGGARPKCNLTDQNRGLNELYSKLREIRDSGLSGSELSKELEQIHALLEQSWPHDWLLRLELLELNAKANQNSAWTSLARARLDEIAATANDKRDMIRRGLELIK